MTATKTVFANALIQIIKNQIEIKEHIHLVRDTSYYGDCCSDYQVIDQLKVECMEEQDVN